MSSGEHKTTLSTSSPITSVSAAIPPNASPVAVSDPHAKYPSLQFTEDELHVKPWDPNNREVVEMAKILTPLQIAWIVSREKAIETLLWSKFEKHIQKRGLYEDWADNAVIPQALSSATLAERDAVQIGWLEAKAPDLVDEFKEHRKGQLVRQKLRERPGWYPS
ncbi:hypothetical protein MMC17_007480 [Xylographa soralifera]|nr:hypothetical protein [Xylographa soralifera]